MFDPVGTQTTASFPQTNSLANAVLVALSEKEASIGYGMLACALTICRLQNTGSELSDDDEITFIESLMEWCGAYFTSDKGKGN